MVTKSDLKSQGETTTTTTMLEEKLLFYSFINIVISTNDGHGLSNVHSHIHYFYINQKRNFCFFLQIYNYDYIINYSFNKSINTFFTRTKFKKENKLDKTITMRTGKKTIHHNWKNIISSSSYRNIISGSIKIMMIGMKKRKKTTRKSFSFTPVNIQTWNVKTNFNHVNHHHYYNRYTCIKTMEKNM